MHTLLLERGLQTNVKKLDINLNPRALGELLKVTFKIFYLPAANQDHLIVVDWITYPRHGNNCAGVIAGAANNSYCGVGLAYNAQIAGMFNCKD